MTVATEGPPTLENMLVGPPPAAIEVRLEPIAKRVRTFVGGVAIADSCRVQMMFETARLGVYYFPIEDVRTDLLVATPNVVASSIKGDASYYSIAVDGRTVDNCAWRYLDPSESCPDIAGFVAFHWKMMDAWLEEDEEVFVHARNPYHRIDVRHSSREVRVVVGGQTLAVSRRAQFLFETGLPVRYYMPKEDVRIDLLQPSPMKTACAYKGPTSQYWRAATNEGLLHDVAWCYEDPAPEVAGIAGMVAFFNERVDAIYVDGEEMPRPLTTWSHHAAPPKHNQLARSPGYALMLSESERRRYRTMAQRAVANEGSHWAAAGVVRGARVVDVGCGPGAVLIEIARLIAPDGDVVGVEPDPAARSAAAAEITAAGITCARVIEATATATGLSAGEFDVVMMRHVLFHVGAAGSEAVAHAASLIRPGGSVYLVDSSADQNRAEGDVDADAVDLMERYVRFQRERGCDVTVGSRLGHLLTAAGLEVTLEEAGRNVLSAQAILSGGPMAASFLAMLAAGAASQADIERWKAGLARTAATPGVTVSIPQFIAVGRRPAVS